MKKTVSKLWEDIFKDYDVLNKIDKFDNFIINFNVKIYIIIYVTK